MKLPCLLVLLQQEMLRLEGTERSMKEVTAMAALDFPNEP
jgi:hypothetical protein